MTIDLELEAINNKLDKILEILERTPQTRTRTVSANTQLLKDHIDARIEEVGYITAADRDSLVEKAGVSRRTWYRVTSEIPKFIYEGKEVFAYEMIGGQSNDIPLTRHDIQVVVDKLATNHELDAEFVDKVFDELGNHLRITLTGKLIMEIINETFTCS